MSAKTLIKDIQAQKIAPIYYLHGEEAYFLDRVVETLDQPGVVLQAHERDFNREVFYGPEIKASHILNACQSFPVMANRRLVILKEAHRFPKEEWEKLYGYFGRPVPSTVLVMLSNDRKVAIPAAGVKLIKKNGVALESRRLYDRDVLAWLQETLADSGFSYDPQLPSVLVNSLGTNIGHIENELEKMFLYLRATGQQELKQAFVFEMINVDKEFNVFELSSALAQRQNFRCHLIIDRLTRNTKINPSVLTIGALFRLFDGIAQVHRFQLRDPNAIKSQLGVNYFQAKDYLAGKQQYDIGRTYRNLAFIQEADLQLKGQTPTNMDEAHILKTLVWKLLS